MLGGNNALGYFGNNTDGVYYVDKSHKNDITCSRTNENNLIFTLEEFIEKFPYKVGDKVLINGDVNDVYTIKSMEWNEYSRQVAYKIEAVDGIMDNHIWFAHEMVFFSPKKEEDMEEKIESFEILESHCANEVKIEFDPSKFEMVKRDDGYYVVKKQPKYPKTYKECCDVLSIAPYYNLRYHTYERCYNEFATANKLCSLQGKLNILGKLLICRDAYWKIAGKQMGLGKPWEPDWLDTNTQKYCIYYVGNEIKKQPKLEVHHFLAFPTAELRNAFYEYFKDLIEECKELL
jgi:hypothetical protein